MAWFNEQPLLTLFLVITVGYFIGQIRIKNFSLESSAILFIALLAGSQGIHLPPLFKTLGLIFFIYAIGLQAGPRFFSLFRKEGMKLNLAALGIVTVGALVTILLISLFHIAPEIGIGLFAGALTSTPGLAAAQEATGSGMTSIGYGIAYPFGVIGVILFIKLLPLLFKTSYQEEAQKEQAEQSGLKRNELCFQHNRVENPAIFNKTLKEIHFRSITHCVISRIQRGNELLIPRSDTVLKEGDIVRVVGREEDLRKATLLVGAVTSVPLVESGIVASRFVVTNKQIIGKTLRQLSFSSYYNANITRIHRGGVEFPALPDQKLEWGDRVTVVGEEPVMNELKNYFGDNIRALEEGNIYSILLGMALGILIGLIPVSIGNLVSIKMGLSGGILLSGLILSNAGKTGSIIWRMPSHIISFIREIGLVLFLAVVGCEAGEHIREILNPSGLLLLLSGALITLVPMILFTILNTFYLRLNLNAFGGLITGGMTSTPGLATLTSSTDSATPTTIYATVYPIAMLGMIIWSKLMAFIL